MSIPNSAARNAMTNSERTIYNWGLDDGRESEQQRIIKLIRQHSKEAPNLHFQYWSALAEAIRLIKGEQE